MNIAGPLLYILSAFTAVGLYVGAVVLFVKIPKDLQGKILLIGGILFMVALAVGSRWPSDPCPETRYYSMC